MNIQKSGEILGATIDGLDLSQPLSGQDLQLFLEALGRYGVLRIPQQKLDAHTLKNFSAQFGKLQPSPRENARAAGLAEVTIISNVLENGVPIGITEVGQEWHTDLTYEQERGFVNALYALRIPTRDGKALGSTLFSNMHQAYEDLPEIVKSRLDGATATHSDKKYFEILKEKGSTRTSAWSSPPVSQPLVFHHPITGRKVLYANPGFTMEINEWEAQDSRMMLDFLFEHQTQKKYCYHYQWSENDLLVWDNLGTIHRAIGDYQPSEYRLMYRCRTTATDIFKGQLPGGSIQTNHLSQSS